MLSVPVSVVVVVVQDDASGDSVCFLSAGGGAEKAAILRCPLAKYPVVELDRGILGSASAKNRRPLFVDVDLVAVTKRDDPKSIIRVNSELQERADFFMLLPIF